MLRGVELADSVVHAFAEHENRCGMVNAMLVRASTNAYLQRYQAALEDHLVSISNAELTRDTALLIEAISALKWFFARRSMYPEALEAMDRAIALRPDFSKNEQLTDENADRASLLDQSGRFHEALSELEKGIGRSASIPADSLRLFMLLQKRFEVLMHSGAFEAALNMATEKAALDPGGMASWPLKRVEALDSLGRYHEALEEFPNAIARVKRWFLNLTGEEVDFGERYVQQARLELRVGDPGATERTSRTFLAKFPIDRLNAEEHIHIHQLRAEACARLGQWKEAYASRARYDQLADSIRRHDAALERTRFQLQYGMQQRLLADSLNHRLEKERMTAQAETRLAGERLRRNGLLFSGTLVGLAALGLWGRLRTTRRAKAQVEREQARSERLLLNILPFEVAQELKQKGEAQARHFDQATILFTDFKGFTEASERMSAQELVQELNACFKAFDKIIDKRGIEKIKTIGDAYMCAGGLPDPGSTSPADVVTAALEMQAFMRLRKVQRSALGLPVFEMRVGIHTGPVIAGIV
ncbi:MAG: hypothetical protein KDB95_11825, partial [Flavobacteriales bacterium]|nr:hypothetical protein [Flavobacteriales bacterium]